jgi:hypothetical protein
VTDPSSLSIVIAVAGPDLLLTGHDDPARDLSVTGYREPAMQARINYAPTGDAHGDVPLSWSYQETVLSFNVFDELSTTEAGARAKIAALVAALGRLSYTVTITVDGATAEVWTCRPGSVVPVDDRTTFDLQSHRAVWTVTIPAYPIRS